MMAHSMDLRLRVLWALDDAQSIARVARRFVVARSTVRDWRDRRAADRLEPGVPGPKDHVKLTDADVQLMRDQIDQQPGITAKQLIPLLSVTVVESTVCRALKKMGLSLKKSP